MALLSTAFGQRRNLPDVLIDHRLHDANASGWIPDASLARVHRAGDGSSDVDVLIDLVVKPPRVRGADARRSSTCSTTRGDAVDPAAARRLRRSLRGQPPVATARRVALACSVGGRFFEALVQAGTPGLTGW